MFIHYRTQGFILKRVNRGGADRIFTVFTKDFGRLEILGKAIRKIKSKLRGGMEIFYLSEIEFIQGKTYKTLTDAILIDSFPNLRKDLQGLSIAYRISEVLDNLIKGQEPDEEIWQLLKETFQKLDNKRLTINNQQLIYYYFLWNLLSILGYQPEFYKCSLCKRKLTPQKLYFSLKERGLICQNCFKKLKLDKEQNKAVDPETVKILRLVLEKKWFILSKLKISQTHLNSIKNISDYYLSFILEKKLL